MLLNNFQLCVVILRKSKPGLLNARRAFITDANARGLWPGSSSSRIDPLRGLLQRSVTVLLKLDIG